MIRLRVLRQVTLMTLREFVRTREALFWTYGFPLVMALSLGLAFRDAKPAPLPVAVVESEVSAAQVEVLRRNPRLEVIELAEDTAREGFERGRYLLLIAPALDFAATGSRIELDPTRPDSELCRLHVERALLPRSAAPRRAEITVAEVTTPGSRYIDWLIPGLIGLNLLSAGLWGVGYNLTQMRVKNILRRLMVTPMRRSEFLIGFLLSRLLLVLPESAAILGFGVLVFETPVHGSLWTVVLLILIGAIAFTGLGMLLASRAQTIEKVAGLMNVAMLPMWLFGGSFVSGERFPGWMQPMVQVLPLTHFNNGMRAVINEGASVVEVCGEIGFLCGFALLALGLAIRVFRWS